MGNEVPIYRSKMEDLRLHENLTDYIVYSEN